jgi:hypothetical protein
MALYRRSAAKGGATLALPSGPVDEPELCFRSPTWWNGSMVFRERGISRMESERVLLVDSWETYVF